LLSILVESVNLSKIIGHKTNNLRTTYVGES